MQAHPQLEPARITKPPFLTTVRLPAPETLLRVDVQLGFTDAADPVLRQVSFEYAMDQTAEQHSQLNPSQLNGTRTAAKSAAVAAPSYATRSASRTDNDRLVCDGSQTLTFVTQRQDYALPKLEVVPL